MTLHMLHKWFSSYMYNHFKSFQHTLEYRAFRFSPIKPIYLTIFISGAPWFVVPMMPRRWDKGDDSMISSSILMIGKKGWIFFKGWKLVNSLTFPWSPVAKRESPLRSYLAGLDSVNPTFSADFLVNARRLELVTLCSSGIPLDPWLCWIF